MAKKIVELSTKRKVELKEMSLDEVDFCNDIPIVKYEDGEVSHIVGLSKSRTAWIRRGILGGDFKSFDIDKNGYPTDLVLKQLSELEKNELVIVIQKYQELGE
tara:strand:- start:251 stop:559 length:309 start_codon:yes stop_codon:yes gene_type:complete